MRKSFNFYASYFEIASELNDNDRLCFYDALISYQLTGDNCKLNQLSGMAKFAYISQKHSIESQVKGHIDKSKSLSNKPFTGYINTEKITPMLDPMQGGVQGGEVQLKLQSTSISTSIIESKKENKINVFDFKKSLLSLGVNESLVNDWLVVRKTKKASNTQTALNGFLNQVELSGLTIEKVIEMCIYKSWVGFEAKWIEKTENVIPIKKNVSNAEFFANMSPEEKEKWF
jgi:hypothetical protein